MATHLKNSLLMITLTFSLLSCSNKPYDGYSFKDINPLTDTAGLYLFDLNLERSDIEYNISIACKFSENTDGNLILPLHITAVSPDGDFYADTVSFPLYREKKQAAHYGKYIDVKDNGRVIDIEWLYRTKVRVSNAPGVWKMNIKIADKNIGRNILGLGVKYQGIDNTKQ